jgi:hypothetical protein
MVRRGRRRDGGPVVPGPGDLVIDGHVRARLLGLRLLELDAHVVVTNAPSRRAVRASPAGVRPSPAGDGVTGSVPAAGPVDRDALPLARAQQLLAEGSSVLAGARRIR